MTGTEPIDVMLCLHTKSSAAPNGVTHAAIVGLRVTLILVFGWLGAMKFTNFEATAIEGLVSSSPFVSWLYGILSVQGASNLIGTVEILIAIGLAAGFVSARVDWSPRRPPRALSP